MMFWLVVLVVVADALPPTTPHRRHPDVEVRRARRQVPGEGYVYPDSTPQLRPYPDIPRAEPVNYTINQNMEASPRIARYPQQPRRPITRLPPRPLLRPSYPGPDFKLPYSVPITDNKVTIPIPIPMLAPNGSLDYNRVNYHPYVIDLSALNLPPDFQPTNFVLKSVTVTPGEPENPEEFLTAPYTSRSLPSYPLSPTHNFYPQENVYLFPEPSRYYKYEDPRYSAPQEYIPPPVSRQPTPLNLRQYSRYPSPPIRYEEVESLQPLPGYEDSDQINPLTGETVRTRTIPSAYSRSYRSYEPRFQRPLRYRTPHDPHYFEQ